MQPCHYCKQPTAKETRFADCVVRPYCGCQSKVYGDTRPVEVRRKDNAFRRMQADGRY